MSPFRSEIEHVKEQLRRAEERARELEEEKAKLADDKARVERALREDRRPWLVVITALLLATGATYVFMAARASDRERRAEAEIIALSSREKAKELECRETTERLESELRACQEQAAVRAKPAIEAAPLRAASGTGALGCACAPDDPLCFCLGQIDASKAKATLDSVDVRDCKRPGGPTGTGHVTVTFAPTGHATSAVVDTSPFAGTPEGACVAAKFRAVTIPPFAGAPVHLGRDFKID